MKMFYEYIFKESKCLMTMPPMQFAGKSTEHEMLIPQQIPEMSLNGKLKGEEMIVSMKSPTLISSDRFMASS